MTNTRGLITLLLAAPMLAVCMDGPTSTRSLRADDPGAGVRAAHHARGGQTLAVSGSGTHFFTTAVVHSQQPTETGMVQRSTDIIELTGDLQGFILYHPVSIFDFAAQTLVNTGTQLFSGTISGSDPVILHDDTFRFDVDLATGQTLGQVRLRRSKDAPHPGGWYECDLLVVGTGMTPAGDATVDYSGECSARGAAR